MSVDVINSSAGRASGYLVRSGSTRILIDCGPGTAVHLDRSGDLDRLDAVIITHEHADHVSDVVGLAYARRFPHPQRPIPLLAPASCQQVISALDRLFAVPSLPSMGHTIDASFDRASLTGDGRVVELTDDVAVSSFEVAHAVPSMAIRIETPASAITFSSDTGPCGAVVEAARDADLFICEATYQEADHQVLSVHGHLTPALAAELANEADVAHLALAHLGADIDPATARALAARHFDADRLSVVGAGSVLETAPSAVTANSRSAP